MYHPYLKLTISDTYAGKYVVGKTARALPYSNGLTNKASKLLRYHQLSMVLKSQK